jgi:protein TonB
MSPRLSLRPSSGLFRLFTHSGIRWDHSFALAIAFFGNALMLMLLGLPRSGEFTPYLPGPDPSPPFDIEVVRPEQQQLAVPDMPVAPTRPVEIATPVDVPPVDELESAPVLAETGSAVAQLAPAGTVSTAIEPAVGSAGVSTGVAYLDAPAPRYPAFSKRRGHEGVVMLSVLVGIDGRPREVRIERGSGYRELDAAAQDQVLGAWRFQPAQRDGAAVEAWVRVPVEFRIQRS